MARAGKRRRGAEPAGAAAAGGARRVAETLVMESRRRWRDLRHISAAAAARSRESERVWVHTLARTHDLQQQQPWRRWRELLGYC